MTNNINHFSGSHYVFLTLEKDTTVDICSFPNNLINHLRYYEDLRESSKVIYYGEVMNQPAVCVILSVSSDNDFEQIISNDPALNSGAYKIKNIMPFVNNAAVTMKEPECYLLAGLEMEHAIG
ncbi:MAG: hypothetical protein JWP94_193 [Mucilaginibacter sp.]|nr:hypothetical protein [Mucilaginibacter sp.]